MCHLSLKKIISHVTFIDLDDTKLKKHLKQMKVTAGNSSLFPFKEMNMWISDASVHHHSSSVKSGSIDSAHQSVLNLSHFEILIKTYKQEYLYFKILYQICSDRNKVCPVLGLCAWTYKIKSPTDDKTGRFLNLVFAVQTSPPSEELQTLLLVHYVISN